MHRSTLYCAVILLVLAAAPWVNAKDIDATPAGPVPSQIATATKIFIGNGGADDLGAIAKGQILTGSPNRSYDEFYAAMKSWGHYEIVSTPASADLILEIRWTFVNVQEPKPPLGLGTLELVIRDRETHAVLWAFQQHVRSAALLGNRDKNFEQAMTDLINNVKFLASPAPVGAAQATSNQ